MITTLALVTMPPVPKTGAENKKTIVKVKSKEFLPVTASFI
jgi:hypothetical protein